ncbi:hypothetical protein BC832DRAFT_67826 [Gaertneriomyces semiglobifer]|nr:hypothetical protein BC832DRAFT_67826 [Gaertneriomyces semiglobifer]
MDPALKALRFDGGSFEEEDDGSPDEEQHFDDSEEEMASYGLGMSEYSDEDARGDMKDTDEGEQRDRRLETEKDLKPARRNLPSVEHEPRDSKWFVRNTAVAPDFVSKFFQSSRLHHLSAWKNTLKQLATKPKKQNGSTDHHPRTIMHVDMDCFFASIAIRDKPHLAKQPVAVCHSQHGSEASTSEIASCNYIARSYGIKNGQLVGPARRSCPELVVVPYEFEKYEDATKKLYQILHRYADEIQPCSCDEALIDVSSQITNVGTGQEVELARQMRRDIKEATGCNASIGISENILLARMATKKAKPNGEFYLASSSKIDFLADCKVGELPGVGWSLSSRLEARGVVYCKDLMAIPKHELQHDHGSKTGEMLYNFARGIDNRPLESESKMRKTVGAEINWGIRLQEMAQVERFLRSFCDEVSERLATAGVKGRSITLKLKQRKADAGEPYKFLGCGDCDNYSKSVVLGRAVDSSSAIYKECLLLYRALAVPPPDLRGVGIHLGKLEEAAAGQGE